MPSGGGFLTEAVNFISGFRRGNGIVIFVLVVNGAQRVNIIGIGMGRERLMNRLVRCGAVGVIGVGSRSYRFVL